MTSSQASRDFVCVFLTHDTRLVEIDPRQRSDALTFWSHFIREFALPNTLGKSSRIATKHALSKRVDKVAVLEALAVGARGIRDLGIAQHFYCFGRLLWTDGELFHRGSDIDLLVIFQPSVNSPEARAQAIERIAPIAVDMALSVATLMRPPKSAAKVISLGAITPFEFENGINAGGEQRFFVDNNFLDICSPDTGFVSVGGETRAELLTEWQDATNVLQEAQKIRKSCLSYDARGKRSGAAFIGPETMPKSLARSAARLQWFTNGRPPGPPSAEKFDYVTGQDYVVNLLKQLAGPNGDVEPYGSVLRLLQVRASGQLQAEQHPVSLAD